jgi:hypothetical protein
MQNPGQAKTVQQAGTHHDSPDALAQNHSLPRAEKNAQMLQYRRDGPMCGTVLRELDRGGLC